MNNLFVSTITSDELKEFIQKAVLEALKEYKPEVKEPEEILTRQQVANLLNVSLVTLSTWTKTGKIPGFRIGIRVRYRKSEVIESMKRIRKFNKTFTN